MKVTTDLRLSDIAVINARNYLGNRSRYLMAFIIALAYGFYLTSGFGLPLDRRGWLILSGGALFFGAFCFVVFLGVGVASALAMVRSHRGIVGRHDIHLLAEGFRDVTEVSDSLTRWPGITRISRNGDYLSFWVSPYLAHIVPARAFSDVEAFAAFERQARTLHAGEALDLPVASPPTPAVLAPPTEPSQWRRPRAG
jgi:hypothetical protein